MQQIPKFFGDPTCGVEIKKRSYEFETWGGATEGVKVNDFVQGVLLEIQEAQNKFKNVYPNQKPKYNLYLYNPLFKGGKIVVWGCSSLTRFLLGADGSLLVQAGQYIQIRYDGSVPLPSGKLMHNYSLAICHGYALTGDDQLAIKQYYEKKQEQVSQQPAPQIRVATSQPPVFMPSLVVQKPIEFVPVNKNEVESGIDQLFLD